MGKGVRRGAVGVCAERLVRSHPRSEFLYHTPTGRVVGTSTYPGFVQRIFFHFTLMAMRCQVQLLHRNPIKHAFQRLDSWK